MTRVTPFYVVFLLPMMLILGVELGGPWTLAPVLFSFVLIPVLDGVLEPNRHNGEEAQGHAPRFDIPLALWVPVQVGTTFYVLWRMTYGALNGLEVVAATVSLGVVNGAGGINIAHELMHRANGWYRAGAEILMTTVSYTHFCVEHVLGHHRAVATPEDPATSRFGETFYRFYLRTVTGGVRSAWNIETERCLKKKVPTFSWSDRRSRYLLTLAVAYVAVYVAMGPLGLALFIAQGIVAFSLLEATNYIEHYGLVRERLANGRYERVRPEHSWNSPHRVSNYYLFNLARHSDHHYLASREYDRLRHYEDVPQFPTGYPAMVLLALVPAAWFRVMDPRVRAWRSRRLAPAVTVEEAGA